jgi:RNA polymerase sigma factor (sigma-70 family)
MTEEELRDDIRRAQAGDAESLERLVRASDGLVGLMLGRVVRGSLPTAIDRDDLRQVGRMALSRAIQLYDPGISKFSTYACRAIKNAILYEIKSALWGCPKVSSDRPCVVSLSGVSGLPMPTLPPPQDDMAQAWDDTDAASRLWELVDADRDGEMVRMWIIDGELMGSIGERYGVTRQRAHQRIQGALHRVREQFSREAAHV